MTTLARSILACSLLFASAHCAVTPAESAAASSARADVAATAPLRGMNIDPRHGASGDAAHPTAAQLASLGVTAARFTFKVQGGDLDEAFRFYDAEVDAYRARIADFRVLFILTGETLEGGQAYTLPDGYVDAFADRAARIAAHYAGRVAAVEVWNEEDDGWRGDHFEGGYGSQLDPDVYARLLNATYDAVKAASPETKVVVGGLDSGQDGYVAQLGEFRADAIATHPYGQWPGDTPPDQGGPWFNLVRNHIAQYRPYLNGRELWFTEWGDGDDGVKPSYIRAFFDDPSVRADVSQAFFFGWCDCQESRGLFGITTDGRTPKPEAWDAFLAASRGDAPPPAPSPGGFADLVVKFPVDAGQWITQCANDDARSQLVWQTSGAGPDDSSRTALAKYPQSIVGSCGDRSGGAYPLVFASVDASVLGGVWVTQCARPGVEHVFRVDGAIDGHPAASFLYDEAAVDCR